MPEAERTAREQRGTRTEQLVGAFEQQVGYMVCILTALTAMEATASCMMRNAAQMDAQ